MDPFTILAALMPFAVDLGKSLTRWGAAWPPPPAPPSSKL